MNGPMIETTVGPQRLRLAPVDAILVLLASALWRARPAVATHPFSHKQSANWAGYAITAASPLRSASGRWTAPPPSCHAPFAANSAFWVGLGGFEPGSQALEQIGTETNCTAAGHSKTYAWYELLRAAPVKLTLPVSPGNVLSARVSVQGRRVTLHIQDFTTGRQFNKTATMAKPDTSSAEWIAEAPSACFTAQQCRPLPLTDFGTVRFTHARATTTRGHTGTITDPKPATTEITLAAGARLLGPGLVTISGASGQAQPSATSHNGGTFAVTFPRTAGPPLPFAAQERLRHAPAQASAIGGPSTVGDAS